MGPKSLPWQSLTHHTVYLGLHWLSAWQSADLYEPISYRHRASSYVITSNRGVEEGLSIFDYPILVYSALDRLANVRDQIVIEGAGYRERLSLYGKLRGLAGSFDCPPSFPPQRESRALIVYRDGYAK